MLYCISFSRVSSKKTIYCCTTRCNSFDERSLLRKSTRAGRTDMSNTQTLNFDGAKNTEITKPFGLWPCMIHRAVGYGLYYNNITGSSYKSKLPVQKLHQRLCKGSRYLEPPGHVWVYPVLWTILSCQHTRMLHSTRVWRYSRLICLFRPD